MSHNKIAAEVEMMTPYANGPQSKVYAIAEQDRNIKPSPIYNCSISSLTTRVSLRHRRRLSGIWNFARHVAHNFHVLFLK